MGNSLGHDGSVYGVPAKIGSIYSTGHNGMPTDVLKHSYDTGGYTGA